MTDQQLTETVKAETETVKPNIITPQSEVKTETEEAKRFAELEKQLKNKTEEAARLHNKIQEHENEKLSEMDKLKKQLADRESELSQLRLTELKRQAGAKHKLPEALVLRLQGNTLEELEKDAEELSKQLPKTTISATNPGLTNGKETEEQQRRRLFGGAGKDIFRPANAAQHGGGVFFNTSNKED